MDERERLEFQERAEQKFFSMLKNGEDIRVFLYFPPYILSEKVQKCLNEYLYNVAYILFEKDPEKFERDFIIYEDEMRTIQLENVKDRTELLSNIIAYFLEQEEYEKCAKIQKLLQKIQGNG